MREAAGVEVSAHIEALRRDGQRLARGAQAAGLEVRAPSCPEWRVRDVVEHTGGVHRWASSFVTSGRSRPTTKEENAAFFVNVPDNELLDWYRAAHASLVDALEAADPSLECWTFLETTSPLAFWARRQAHETAIHRVDVEETLGEVGPIDAEFAADGVDELLMGFLARSRGTLVSDPPLTLGVRSSDTDHAWTVRIEADKRLVSRHLSNADCVISAPANVLYLFLWNRQVAEDSFLDVEGDRSVLELWSEKATI